MDENKIADALERSNKWWKDEFKLDFKPRDAYDEIQKFMHTRQIIALTGLRRVGKTTIMFKVIKDSISGFGKENIVYFSFDDFRDTRLDDIFRVYSRLMNKDINKTKYIFLFDEIQKLENWEEQLKVLYDNYSNNKQQLLIRNRQNNTQQDIFN